MIKDNNKGILKSRIAALTMFAHNDRKRAAFTLAEVLITLGIIGVVAAMTIPMFLKNYQKKVTATRLKQTYSIISNAVNMAKIENGDVSTWGINYASACVYSSDPNSSCYTTDQYGANYQQQAVEYSDYIIKHLKIDKKFSSTGALRYTDLGYPVKNNCVISFKNSSCYIGNWSKILGQAVRLPNGVIVFFTITNADAIKMITIDVNGTSLPNIVGRDLFYFSLDNNGQIRSLYGNSTTGIDRNNCSLMCSAFIMNENWEINYDW